MSAYDPRTYVPKVQALDKLLRRFLDNHCQASDQEGMSTLCECPLCLDTRASLADVKTPKFVAAAGWTLQEIQRRYNVGITEAMRIQNITEAMRIQKGEPEPLSPPEQRYECPYCHGSWSAVRTITVRRGLGENHLSGKVATYPCGCARHYCPTHAPAYMPDSPPDNDLNRLKLRHDMLATVEVMTGALSADAVAILRHDIRNWAQRLLRSGYGS